MKTQIIARPQAKPSEADILRLNFELTTAREELDALSYSVSHDLRAPLRHILGYVEILQAGVGSKLDAASRRQLQTIAESAAQMWAMIDALLEFSRMGRAKLHCQLVNLTPLVADARRELSRETKGRVIDWKIGDLPEVQGDPTLLRQAIVQFLANAIKFTRPQAHAKIEVGAKTSDHETICFVRDNGVGFDMKGAIRLFGAFQRFHRLGEFDGAGIGLAVVRRIIHRHGGRTWAEAKVGGGATFYFSLPKVPETEAELNPEESGDACEK